MRTTHDINLDHHGLLDPARIDGGFSSTVPLGGDVGQYSASDSLLAVVRSLDERLTAESLGIHIRWAQMSAGAFVQPYMTADAWIQPTFTSDAFIQPYFTADAEITA